MKLIQFQRIISILAILTILVISLFQPTGVHAHALSASFGELVLKDTNVTYTFSIDDLSVIENLEIDSDSNSTLSQEEVDVAKNEITDWISRNIVIQSNGVSQRPLIGDMKVEKRNDKNVVTTTFLYVVSEGTDKLTLQDSFYTDSDNKTTYTQLLTINNNGELSESILKGENRKWESSIAGTGEKATGTPWYSFFILGMEHILTGYDHLLFLFVLLLARQSFKDYVKVVTAFTVAHSITLTLGYLDIFVLPSIVVESIIALSIVYVAIENIVRKEVKRRWILTFAFGLIHGLGFAGLLSEMSIPKGHLVLSLLSFNLGIEIIQVALVALLIPVLSRVQKLTTYPTIMKYGSVAIIIIGGYWVIERVFQL
ncbi:HupE/UreJ family protein [Bacillus sp. DJP31]|uniref:HupE/UreJ family protein n=1 Tax=Bacillus sp. DJP31 TaxID=3409789 RepID=UPI003BB5C8A9